MVGLKEIEERVTHLVACQFGRDQEEIHATTHFVDDLQADSLDVVELAMAFEDEFKVDFSNEEIHCLNNVRSA